MPEARAEAGPVQLGADAWHCDDCDAEILHAPSVHTHRTEGTLTVAWTLDDSARDYPWRVGRKLGRTVYAQEGADPSDDDPLLGLMETEEIAESVVEFHNAIVVARHG